LRRLSRKSKKRGLSKYFRVWLKVWFSENSSQVLEVLLHHLVFREKPDVIFQLRMDDAFTENDDEGVEEFGFPFLFLDLGLSSLFSTKLYSTPCLTCL
jgi:hypothetical protein